MDDDTPLVTMAAGLLEYYNLNTCIIVHTCQVNMWTMYVRMYVCYTVTSELQSSITHL